MCRIYLYFNIFLIYLVCTTPSLNPNFCNFFARHTNKTVVDTFFLPWLVGWHQPWLTPALLDTWLTPAFLPWLTPFCLCWHLNKSCTPCQQINSHKSNFFFSEIKGNLGKSSQKSMHSSARHERPEVLPKVPPHVAELGKCVWYD